MLLHILRLRFCLFANWFVNYVSIWFINIIMMVSLEFELILFLCSISVRLHDSLQDETNHYLIFDLWVYVLRALAAR